MIHCVATEEGMFADTRGTPLGATLDMALEKTPKGPLTILIHGYRYCPFHQPNSADPELRNPHALLYACTPSVASDRVASWTSGLDLPGVVLGLGWPAMPSDPSFATGVREFEGVYQRADSIARQLARLLDHVASVDPTRRINLVAHSLGARVALNTLPYLMRAEPARILLWGAAERHSAARQAILNGPASTEIINVTAHANLPYDTGFRLLGPGKGPTLGGTVAIEGVATLSLDDTVTERNLANQNHPLGPLRARRCHWLFYTRQGVMPLYRDMLTRPAYWSLPRIEALAHSQRPRFAWPTLPPRIRPSST